MTKKEILKASEDSLDAIIDELQTIGMEGLIEAVTGGPKVMAAYRMVADTAGISGLLVRRWQRQKKL